VKKENDVASEAKQAAGKKPHNIKIKMRSDVDRWCVEKNAWDEVVKTLIPKILDINVLQWEGHEPSSLDKFKVTLDKEFEYVDNELSIVKFKNVVKIWLKTERCKLKAIHLGGKIECPVNIEPTHWEKLKVYWSKPKTKRKAQ